MRTENKFDWGIVMAYETILVDTGDSDSVLTMNRPERLNAWTPKMGAELSEAIPVSYTHLTLPPNREV